MNRSLAPARVCLCLCFAAAGTAAHAATIAVSSAPAFQAALTNAQPGDTILLDPAGSYLGNFTLPNKGGSTFITIRSAAQNGLPGDGGRISPSASPLLPKLRSPNSLPTLATAPGAHHWRLMLLELQANAGGYGDIMTLGDGSAAQNNLAQVPHDLVVDRVYIHGDPALGQKRGIALNSASTTITGCYIADIKAVGQDSQAIAGWNGPGPYSITNDYLEAAAENITFGGSDPAIPNLVPADITVAGNLVSKPPIWRTQNWVVKNLFELKNARRVEVADNTFEYNWQGGQSGFAILFTVRDQSGGCPWCQVDHVTFERNVVRHSAAGVEILGYDNNHPSQQTQAIVIRENVFWDIDKANWGGNGYFLQLSGQPRDITVDHNTIASDHSSGIITCDGPPILDFVFTNNVAKHNSYGIIGADHGVGDDSISTYLPASQIERNVIAGGQASRYPADNLFPTTTEFEAQFVSYAGADFHLVAGSAWRGAGLDGRDLGTVFESESAPPDPSSPAAPSQGGPTPTASAGSLQVNASVPQGVVGAPYSASLSVLGGVAPFAWSLASGALPAGISFDANSAAFVGQAQNAGVFTVVVAVRDSSTPPRVGSAGVQLLFAPTPLALAAPLVPYATAGDPYSVTFTAAGGQPPYRWSIVSGALPFGLTLDPASGTITGTPRRRGSMLVTIGVSDSWVAPQTATTTIAIHVDGDPLRSGRPLKQ